MLGNSIPAPMCIRRPDRSFEPSHQEAKGVNTTTEILIAAGIIGSTLMQFGKRTASVYRLLAPIGIVGAFAVIYLKAIPTSGNDGLFALSGALIGLVLGVAAAVLMGVGRRADGRAVLVAGLVYMALWIGVFGARLAFVEVAQNSPETLRQLFIWAYQNGITEQGWTAFFMLQAIVMVGIRTAIVGARVLLLPTAPAESEMQAA